MTAVAPAVNGPPETSDADPEVRPNVSLEGEPIRHLKGAPGTLEVELPDLDSLLDGKAAPTFPHASPMLNGAVAKFMLDAAREDRRSPRISITLAFRSSPLQPEQEAWTRARMSHFFANEAEMAALAQRVNSTEAWGSMRFAMPVIAVAAIIGGLFLNPSTLNGGAYVSELAYLIAIVVIWVMVWDPIEKLLFESYFIRLRIRALRKLQEAQVTFAYRTGPAAPKAATPVEQSASDKLANVLEGG